VAAKPEITIVGAGRLGTSLALALFKAGYRITEIVSRPHRSSRTKAAALARKVKSSAVPLDEATFSSKIIWLCVPDREISRCARSLAQGRKWRGKIVFHSSGALTSDELSVLRKQGAAVASLHPLMTFVPGVLPLLAGVPFAVEGDARAINAARKIVRALGAEVFAIRKQHKVAYHAWGAFTSPMLVATLAMAESVAKAAGLSRAEARKRMLPIVRQTILNYAQKGPAGAFSGPLIRGDVDTVRRHLQILKTIPDARNVYGALATSALRTLPVKNRKTMKKALTSQ